MIFEVEVFRMSGAGNLFSVIDNRKYNFSDEQLIRLSEILCNINSVNSFSAEGFLSISDSQEFDFEVKFYNPDGSTGMMCGNGGRCAIDFALTKIFKEKENDLVTFKMAGNIYQGAISDEGIRIILPAPKQIQFNKIIEIDYKSIGGTYINVSSDHFVINFSDLKQFNIKFDKESINNFAPKIRSHNDFGAKGTNVNIFRKVGDIVYLNTFERGVESITGACGTGAVSTAIHCHFIENMNLPIMISPPSAIPLFIDFEKNEKDEILKIILIGHSEITGRDVLRIEL
jgi:diaminopimelate epimerase